MMPFKMWYISPKSIYFWFSHTVFFLRPPAHVMVRRTASLTSLSHVTQHRHDEGKQEEFEGPRLFTEILFEKKIFEARK